MWISLIPTLVYFSVALWSFGKSGDEGEIKSLQQDLPADLKAFQTLRVVVLKGVPAVTIETASSYHVYDGHGRALYSGKRILATRVQAKENGIQIGKQFFRDVPVTIQSEGLGIKVENRLYRHALTLWPEADYKINVVNELPLEDYLRGVLPWEASPGWHAEALKAQAVASRTFALFRALEHREDAFDLSSDTLSQVYKGRSIENQKTDAAIRETRGEILTYRGKIFPAFFHSTCGAHTAAADSVWNVQAHPVLQGVACQFCKASKHYFWNGDFSAAAIQSALGAHGIPVSNITAIDVETRDRAGRALTYRIRAGKLEKKILASDFRLWLDPARFKSTLIDAIRAQGDTFTFQGRGWGHGVGMCQYGMKRLAELGYSYHQILDYYYPGAQIVNTAKWDS